MFQSTPVTGRQRHSEELTPLPNVIIPLKGEVSNRSQFSMSLKERITEDRKAVPRAKETEKRGAIRASEQVRVAPSGQE
jgi:hypothetical protein